MARKKSKRIGRLQAKLITDAQYGPEPDLRGYINTSDILKAFNWYSMIVDADKKKAYALNYLAAKQFKYLKILKNAPSWEFNAIGTTARILSLEGNLPEEYKERMNKRIAALVVKYNSVKEEKIEIASPKNAISIQDHINEKTSNLIGEIEGAIDDFSENDTEFVIGDFMRKYNIKPMIAKRIAEKFRPLYAELFDAIKGKDDQLKEAYKIHKKSKLKAMAEFVKSIIAGCETQIVALKQIRKPRKKKEKPAFKVVEKLKFAAKSDDFKLESIKPTEIIGAQQLWVFNTKKRQLGVYIAIGPTGLSVKGSSIQSFDEKLSVGKKVRKPEQILPKIIEGGKVALRHSLTNIKAIEKTLTGRINGDTILMRVVR